MKDAYIGKTFYDYTVLGIDEEKTKRLKRTHYKCRCHSCKQEFSPRIEKINNYDLLVCCKDCSPKVRKNKYPKIKIEKDKIIGDFLILEKLGFAKGPQTHENYWKCKCIYCSQEKEINAAHLKAGQNTCNCRHQSKGERKIESLLIENKIPFKREFIFSDLSNRRFDFAILKNNKVEYLIEYDGEQHFSESSFCNDSLVERRKRDEEKNSYCLKNNIPLIRIPYTILNDLTLEDVLLDSKYKL